MGMKFESRCGCIEFDHRRGCIAVVVLDRDGNEICRASNGSSGEFCLRRDGVEVLAIGDREEGEVSFRIE